MSYWIDSHCHINEERYKKDFDNFLSIAKQNNVLRNNVICLNKEEYLYTLQKQQQYPFLDISFGYFPEDADHVTDEDLQYLESVVDSLVAVGEIGLDYHWDDTKKDVQKQLFIKQLEIAKRHNKPVIIHSRDAAKDTYDILKEYAGDKVLMHCFSESNEMMKQYLKLGYYISFSGVVTFNNATEPKKNAKEVPLDKMMIETDCPYLTPVPFRGQMNQTAYVRYVGEHIAQLKDMDPQQLMEQLMENYRRFFDEKD